MAMAHLNRSRTRNQVLLVLALQLFAFVVLGGPLLATGMLVNDRSAHYSLFRDALHSLNVYGEFPWWNPSIRAGFPFYYIELLLWPGREPIFAAIATGVWLAGRAGLTIESYFGLYVVYFALLVPLLLSLSVFALARQILRHPLAIDLAIVLTAFSPAVVFSLSDIGGETTAYGFLFAAAWLAFVRTPDRNGFLQLCVTAMVLAVSLVHGSLYWNVFFVPAFTLLVCVGRTADRARFACRQIPARWWAAAAVGIVLCALPTVLTYLDGADILAPPAEGRRYYAYDRLRPGNPLEALAVSTPGVGFDWTEYQDPKASLIPLPVSSGGIYSSYGYMGLLTLPLIGVGLVIGRAYWSIRLYGCIAAVITIMMLSAYSPIFSLLLGWPSPLRAVNHYSDMALRVGLCGLFIMAAGLGLEALLRPASARRWLLLGLFAATSATSVIWLVRLHAPGATHNYLFGLAIAFMLLYVVGVARLACAATAARRRYAVVALLALLLVDTSTMAFAHLRLAYGKAAPPFDDPGSDRLGSVAGRADGLLYLRGMDDPGLDDAPVPPVRLLVVDAAEPQGDQRADIIEQSYNSITIDVRAARQARVEWRDAYFPFWRASVNGADVPIIRTSENTKAVLVPAGTSRLVFRFLPAGVRAAAACSYVAVAIVLAYWVRARRRFPRR